MCSNDSFTHSAILAGLTTQRTLLAKLEIPGVGKLLDLAGLPRVTNRPAGPAHTVPLHLTIQDERKLAESSRAGTL